MGQGLWIDDELDSLNPNCKFYVLGQLNHSGNLLLYGLASVVVRRVILDNMFILRTNLLILFKFSM